MNEATEHNPDNLTPEQYGAPEYELLTREEVLRRSKMDASTFPQSMQVESWFLGEWGDGFHGGHLGMTYRRRVATRQPEESEARREDFEEPEFTRLKAQKDAIVAREAEKLRDEGRRSVILIRCTNCLTIPQQNTAEFTGAECGGCIAKQRDDLLSLIEELRGALEWALGKEPSPCRCILDHVCVGHKALARAEAMKGDR